MTPVTHAFLHALQCRAGDRSWLAGNLYSDGRAVGAQARAFENFCREAPLVPISYRMAQGAMESWVRTQCVRHGKRLRLALVDVGLGRGLHLRGFLENPALASWIEDLRVVGIEPSWAEGPAQGVHQVASDLTQFARAGGVPLAFCPLAAPAEEVDADTLRSRVGSGCDAVLALGSFSLHHTVGPQEGTLPARERVLKTLRRCGAQGLVLTEPDSNHVSSSLRLRFLHSYRHYRILYDALVSYVGPRHAWILWRDFFGQEVVNILAHEGMHHVERHEDMGTWAQRLARCGWAVEDLRGEVPALALPAGLQVRGDEKGLRLLFRGEPLVAVLRASSVWH